MREKDAIRQAIIKNIEEKKRDPNSNLDSLEFLITSKVTESDFFELSEPIILKNSWRNKTANYLITALGISFLIYWIIKNSDFRKWWLWFVLILMIIGGISSFVRFFENKIVIEISAAGLTFENYVFNKWDEIEFLYFKTKYDGNGNYDGTYLVEKLKNGYEHELMISDLPWSTDELGRTLYQCMKRYGK